MTDETLTTDTPADAQPNAPTTPAAVNTPDSSAQPQDHMIPKARFDEVNNELKKIKADMAKAQAASDKAAAAALAEQGKFKELYETASGELETLRPYKERVEQMIAQVQANNAKRIEAIPEDRRTLVPSFDDPLQVQDWLNVNEKHLIGKAPAPDLNGGSGNRTPNSNPNAPSLAQIKEQAVRLGVDVKHLAASYGVSIPDK